MVHFMRFGMAFLPAAWIELLVMVQVYITAAVYVIKELIFEVTNRGIRKQLENDIMRSNAIRSDGIKCIFVTGGDGTIGREVIKKFLQYGYTVHATVGDRIKSMELFALLDDPQLPLRLYDVDLLTPYEVAMFTRRFMTRCRGVSTVVMCAGTMLAAPEEIIFSVVNTALAEILLVYLPFVDNVEGHMCVNVVSQALLLHLLNPVLVSDARIVFLSSAAAKVSHFTSLIFQRDPLSYYVGRYQAYCFSKLVLSVYVEQLSRKKSQSFATVHPGVIPGTLYRHTNNFVKFLTYSILPFFLRKPAFSSLLIAHTALRDDLVSGSYYEDGVVKCIANELSRKDKHAIFQAVQNQVEAWTGLED